MRLTPCILSVMLAMLAPGTGHGQEAPVVVVGDAGPSINAHASIRIHASRGTIWAILSSCPEALKIVPSLKACYVLERAPDGSWERIWQSMEYFRFLPRVKFEVKVNYMPPASVTFERVSGALVSLRGTWILQSDGDDTVAHYEVAVEPGLWVPNWIVRAALKHDLPKMLQALRSESESTHPENLG
jgi:polyketide cyclase/dehydrase/lipid transport protein